MLFNKPSDMTYREWLDSNARYLLNQIPKDVVEWIYGEDMTDEEKAAHPTYETTGGYLKVLDESEGGQLWWDSLSDRRKKIIKAIPNFDAEIFFQCTGIKNRQVVLLSTNVRIKTKYQSIFTEDMHKCYITGSTENVDPHHILVLLINGCPKSIILCCHCEEIGIQPPIILFIRTEILMSV